MKRVESEKRVRKMWRDMRSTKECSCGGKGRGAHVELAVELLLNEARLTGGSTSTGRDGRGVVVGDVTAGFGSDNIGVWQCRRKGEEESQLFG